MNTEKIQQPFKDVFPGDLSLNTMQRQTPHVLFCDVVPEKFPKAELLLFNDKLSEETGLGTLNPEQDLPFLAASSYPSDKIPYSTAYGGHQFGKWAGQLGDGRAILAGEIISDKGIHTELQWKGAGATPYSRHADGRAVLRSSLREYLMSEAMYFMGVPTTRALSLVKTGEKVVRDIMYNGRPEEEDGAVMMRTAESFLRFGHFELISASGNKELLQKLMDDTIERYFPEINPGDPQRYLLWLKAVAVKTADLVVEWFRTGFVHGVMNTDNMSVLGLTVDYGPFAMLEDFDLNFTSNTTDLPGKRYAFGKQAQIAQWNLWQLMNAVYPIVNDQQGLQQILGDFGKYFWQKHDEMTASKFGFQTWVATDTDFFTGWQHLMQDLQLDYTLFFTALEGWLKSGQPEPFSLENISYKHLNDSEQQSFADFLIRYQKRLLSESSDRESAILLMQKNNPKFILRNYLLYECIQEVEAGHTEMLSHLLEALQHPYEMRYPELCIKRPEKYNLVPGCSMLSCSS